MVYRAAARARVSSGRTFMGHDDTRGFPVAIIHPPSASTELLSAAAAKCSMDVNSFPIRN